MKKGLVNIAQGTPEQLSKLKVFLANSQVIHKGLKTHADAVVFAIQEAQKVPELEKEILKLRAEKWELEKDKGLLLEDVKRLKEKIKELEKKQLTKEESRCVWNSLSDLDLCNTEDEEYSNTVKAVLRKLEM